MTVTPRLLIDADGFLYKAVAAAEYEADWGDGVIVLSTNLNQAKDMFRSQIASVCEHLESEDIVLVISGSSNFRYQVDPSYKSNRKGNRKPLGFHALISWMKEQYGDKVIHHDLLEADDYLGILATKPNAPQSIIVTDDKDLKTIPGTLYRMGELSTIDEDQAERYWLYQTLTGDPVDGYKGCPGIGPVSAEKLLSKPGNRWDHVKHAYLKAGLTEDHAITQARLARILRYEDWDSINKVPILWSPPT